MFILPIYLAFSHHDSLALQEISNIWESKTDNNRERSKEIMVDRTGRRFLWPYNRKYLSHHMTYFNTHMNSVYTAPLKPKTTGNENVRWKFYLPPTLASSWNSPKSSPGQPWLNCTLVNIKDIWTRDHQNTFVTSKHLHMQHARAPQPPVLDFRNFTTE